MTRENNSKSFIVTVKNSQSYQFFIRGFTVTELWFIMIRQSLLLSATLLMTSKLTTTLSLDKIFLNMGTMFLTTKMTTTVIKQILLDAVASLKYSVTTTLSNSLLLNYVIKLTSKTTAATVITNVLEWDMITAILNFLGDYDGETLGTLDPETLGDLDYTIV